MTKEQVNKFDLEAAFKALDEIETPKTDGLKANRVDLKERFNSKSSTEVLVEEFYDVNVREDLETAQEEREAEIAKAKLARIEKIVDLDAESEEDLLPSYVGKVIIQCPQCMTLFYKNQEDIEKSEENPEIVNINEICQHCGNSSGYTLIGKVDTVGEDEAENYDVEDFDDNELNLNFDDTEEVEEENIEATEETEEEVVEEPVENEEVESEEDLDLEPVEEIEDEEEVKESLNEEGNAAWQALSTKERGNIALVKNNEDFEATDNYILYGTDSEGKVLVTKHYTNPTTAMKNIVVARNEIFNENENVETVFVSRIYHNIKENTDLEVELDRYTAEKNTQQESLNEDLDDQIKEWNDYVDHLQAQLKDAEDRLAKAKNELVKKSIQAKIDALKAELDEALPTVVKDEIKAEDLPTPEEAGVEDATENKEDEEEEVKESLVLTEGWDNQVAEADKVLLDIIYKSGNEKYDDGDGYWSSEDKWCDRYMYYANAVNNLETVKSLCAQHSTDDCQFYVFEDDSEEDPVSEIGYILKKTTTNEALNEDLNEDIKSISTEAKNSVPVEEALVGDVNINLDARGQSVGLLKGQGGEVHNTMTEEKEDLDEFIGPAVASIAGAAGAASVANSLSSAVSSLVSEDMTEAVDDNLDKVLDSPEFKKPISEEEVNKIIRQYESLEDLEDLNESLLNDHVSAYLQEVYENTKTFTVTACNLETPTTLVVEGLIEFKSGKTKPTKFVFEQAENNKLVGINEDLTNEKAFTLNYSIKENVLMTESFEYKYTIENTLVEGLK